MDQEPLIVGPAVALLGVWERDGRPVLLVNRAPKKSTDLSAPQLLSPGMEPIDIHTGFDVAIPMCGNDGWVVCIVQPFGEELRLWRKQVDFGEPETTRAFQQASVVSVSSDGTVRAMSLLDQSCVLVWPPSDEPRFESPGPEGVPKMPFGEIRSGCGRWRAWLAEGDGEWCTWVAPVSA